MSRRTTPPLTPSLSPRRGERGRGGAAVAPIQNDAPTAPLDRPLPDGARAGARGRRDAAEQTRGMR